MASNKDQIEQDVLIRILGDSGSFSKEAADSARSIRNLGGQVKNAAEAVKQMVSEFDKLAKHLDKIGTSQALRLLGSGGLKTSLINAQVQGELNKIKASLAGDTLISAQVKRAVAQQKAQRDAAVLNLSKSRVTFLGESRAELNLQIEATKLREADLASRSRAGYVTALNGKKITEELTKERAVLDQLIAKREKLIDLEKTQGQLSRISQKISAAGSLSRTARAGEDTFAGTNLAQDFRKDRFRQVINQAALRLEQERTKALAGQSNAVSLYEQRLASLQGAMRRYVDETKRASKAEADLSRSQAKAPALTEAQKLAAQRDYSVKRVTGDGGASIFKIQGQLAANYLVMNSLFNLIGYGSQFVLQLDNSFKQLQAITATTDTEMKGLKQTIIDASQATRFMATDVANAATVLGQAGFTGRQISEAIKPIAQFATAVGSSLEEAVDVVTSSLSIFNMRAEETGYVANVLTGALNLSKLNMEKLALGMQYAGNIAAQSGVTFEELTAVLAAMSQSGIRSGSTLGTGLREVIVSLQAPTEELTSELASVGLTLTDVDIKSKGLTAVLKTMKEAGFGSANAFRSMEVRGAAAYSAILNQVDTLESMQQQFILSNAAVEANNIQMQSLSANIDRTKNAFGTLVASGFEPLGRSLALVLGGLANVINAISRSKVAAVGLTVAVTSLVASFTAIKIAALVRGLSEIRLAVTGVTNQFNLASKSATLFGIASRGVFGSPIILAVVGVTAALTTLGIGLGSMSDKLDELKADVDETRGRFEEWQSRIQSVDEQIDQIGSRYQSLSTDHDALNTEVLKAITSFGQFGLELGTTETTVDSLVGSLSKLRGELAKLSSDEAKNTISTIKLRLAGLETEAQGILSGSVLSGKPDKLISTVLGPGAGTAFRQALQNSSFDPTRLEDRAYRAETEKSLTDAFSVLTGIKGTLTEAKLELDKKVKKQGSDFSITTSGIREATISPALDATDKAIASITTRFSELKQLSGTLSAARGAELAQDPQVIAFRKILDEAKTKQSYDAIASRVKASNPGLSDNPEEFDKRVQAEARKVKDSITPRIKGVLDNLIKALETEGDKNDPLLKQSLEAFKEEFNKWDQGYETTLRAAAEGLKKINDNANERIQAAVQIEQQNLDDSFNSAKQSKNLAKLKELSAKKEEFVRLDTQRKIDDLEEERKNTQSPSEKKAIQRQITALQVQGNIQLQTVKDELEKAVEEISRTPKGAANMADKMKLINSRIAASNAELQAAIDEASIIKRANETPGSVLYNKYSKQEISARERESQKNQRELASRQFSQYSNEFNTLQKQTGKGKEYFAGLGEGGVDRLEELSGASKDYVAVLKAQQEVYTKLIEAQQQDMLLNGTGATQVTGFYNQFKLAIEETIAANEGMGSSYSYLSDLVETTFSNAKSAMGNFVKEAVTGTKSIGQAFKDMASNILSSMLDVVSNQIAQQFMGSILGYVGKSFGPSAPTDITAYAIGGPVRRAGGGGLPPRDVIHTLLQPGEYVLRKTAVDALGLDTLNSINSLGNTTTSSSPVPVLGTQQVKDGGVVNVYVISPEAKPSLTPNDVIVTITEDMARGGKTKQLVKSIAMGK